VADRARALRHPRARSVRGARRACAPAAPGSWRSDPRGMHADAVRGRSRTHPRGARRVRRELAARSAACPTRARRGGRRASDSSSYPRRAGQAGVRIRRKKCGRGQNPRTSRSARRSRAATPHRVARAPGSHRRCETSWVGCGPRPSHPPPGPDRSHRADSQGVRGCGGPRNKIASGSDRRRCADSLGVNGESATLTLPSSSRANRKLETARTTDVPSRSGSAERRERHGTLAADVGPPPSSTCCNLAHVTSATIRDDRVVVQGNRLRTPDATVDTRRASRAPEQRHAPPERARGASIEKSSSTPPLFEKGLST